MKSSFFSSFTGRQAQSLLVFPVQAPFSLPELLFQQQAPHRPTWAWQQVLGPLWREHRVRSYPLLWALLPAYPISSNRVRALWSQQVFSLHSSTSLCAVFLPSFPPLLEQAREQVWPAPQRRASLPSSPLWQGLQQAWVYSNQLCRPPSLRGLCDRDS